MEKSGNFFKGIVVQGDGEANSLFGIPTANLQLSSKPEVEIGIYASRIKFKDKQYNASISWGPEDNPKFEVHILDFDQEIYGEEIEGEIVKQVSEFVEMYTVERLRQKILHDIDLIKQFFDSEEN